MVDYKDQMRQSTEYATEHLWNAHQEFDFGVSGQTGLYRETLTWKQNKTKHKNKKKEKEFYFGTGDGSAIKSTCYSCRGPRLGSQG